MNNQQIRLLGFGFIILYFSLTLIIGFITPNYNSSIQLMSELHQVGAPYGFIMRPMLMTVGIWLIIFSYFFHFIFKKATSWVPEILMMIIGACLFVGGIFQCDVTCKPVTTTGWIHVLTGVPSGLALFVLPFLYAKKLKINGFDKFSKISFYFGPLIIITMLLAIFLFPPDLPGLGQRIATFVQLSFILFLFYIIGEVENE